MYKFREKRDSLVIVSIPVDESKLIGEVPEYRVPAEL